MMGVGPCPAVQPVHSQLLASKSAFFSGMWADVRSSGPLAFPPAPGSSGTAVAHRGRGSPAPPHHERLHDHDSDDAADVDAADVAMDVAGDGDERSTEGGRCRHSGSIGCGGGARDADVVLGSASGGRHDGDNRTVIEAALEGRHLHDVLLFLCAVYRNVGPANLDGEAGFADFDMIRNKAMSPH